MHWKKFSTSNVFIACILVISIKYICFINHKFIIVFDYYCDIIHTSSVYFINQKCTYDYDYFIIFNVM